MYEDIIEKYYKEKFKHKYKIKNHKDSSKNSKGPGVFPFQTNKFAYHSFIHAGDARFVGQRQRACVSCFISFLHIQCSAEVV